MRLPGTPDEMTLSDRAMRVRQRGGGAWRSPPLGRSAQRPHQAGSGTPDPEQFVAEAHYPLGRATAALQPKQPRQAGEQRAARESMFARDWRGVASAPLPCGGPALRLEARRRHDGSGVVAVVGRAVGRLVDLSGLNDELDETFGHDLPGFHRPSGVCLRQLQDDPHKEPKEEVQELVRNPRASTGRAHLTAKMPERCCVSGPPSTPVSCLRKKNDNWI